jgi:RNA polymerase sigma-70 factor (ECF subfamily)
MPTPIALFPASYDAAYTYYFPILFRFALHQLHDVALSKDLAQETLIQFWKKRDPNITKKKMLESFLFQILKNRMIDHFRKQQLRYQFHNTYDPQKSIEADSTLFDVEDRIAKVYASLPEKTAALFKASREEGLSYKEIAETFQLSVKTVEFHISKALKRFKKEFDPNELG